MNGGLLPWTHFAQDGSVVWELDHRCEFDWASDAIAQAQKDLIVEEENKGLDVTLVDTGSSSWKTRESQGCIPLTSCIWDVLEGRRLPNYFLRHIIIEVHILFPFGYWGSAPNNEMMSLPLNMANIEFVYE